MFIVIQAGGQPGLVAVRSAHIEPPRGTALDSGPECRRLRQV